MNRYENGKRLKRDYKYPTSVRDFGVTYFVRLENDVEYGLVDIVRISGHDYYFLIKKDDIDDWCIRKRIEEDGKGYLVSLADEDEFQIVFLCIMDPPRNKSKAMKELMLFWANGSVRKKRMFNREFIFFLIALSCISMFVGYFTTTYGWLMTSSKLPANNIVAYTNGSLIQTHIETLKLLDDSHWFELTLQERLDIMQCVANIEATYLGLPDALIVKTGELREGRIGSYYHTSRTIILSTSYLMSENNCGYSTLELLLHEVFHSYQYWLVAAYKSFDEIYRNLLLFDHIRNYELELKLIDRDGSVYFWGSLEERADSFAYHATMEYMEKINALVYEAE
jgi:hypothetical protein